MFSTSGIVCDGKYQPTKLYWDSNEWKVPANMSLFIKNEKILALFYLGKGTAYMPFDDFRLVPSTYQPPA
jgi:hypothetical protein